MQQKKNIKNKKKTRLHPRNKNIERYNFNELISTTPELKPFVHLNPYGDESIDFANPDAVKALNKALLKYHYHVDGWDIPENYLCPPIPGRADYIHNVADLLRDSNYGNIPKGNKIKCFDIGVGANCIYPIIGNKEYGWSFIGSDIDKVSVESAKTILELNADLKEYVEIKFQKSEKDFFYGVINKDEKIDLSVCNPPFYASIKEAKKENAKKVSNLVKELNAEPKLNFGGQPTELVTEGGEERFVKSMIRESKKFSKNCFWFTTLISKKNRLNAILPMLEHEKAIEIKVIPMGQGNKTSRILAWTFLTEEEQKDWKNSRWAI